MWHCVYQLHVLDKNHNPKYEEVQRQVLQSGSVYTIATKLEDAVSL